MGTTDRVRRSTFGAVLVALLLTLSSGPAPAYDTLVVVTYVEYRGRVIELAETLIDQLIGIPGAMLALDDAFLPDGDNLAHLNHADTIVRAWKRDGDDAILIFFREQEDFIRFPADAIKVRVIDRPWIEPQPTPDTVKPV